MEIPLKAKYRTRKIVKACKSPVSGSAPKKHKKQGPKSYVYGSRVMLVDGLTGKYWMVDGNI